MPEIINEENFSQKVDVSGPVLVEFFATWCPHCHRMQPVVDQLTSELTRVEPVYQIDIDRSPQLAQVYASQGVPTFVLFDDGKVAKSIAGEQSIETLRNFAA